MISSPAPGVVLDTNVVLDWLVFDDPTVHVLASAIRNSQLHWLVTPAMRAELDFILQRSTLGRWHPQRAAVLDHFDALSRPAGAPPPNAYPATPRCRDASDQIFIDLACATGARWLLTRDAALLSLARRARDRGVNILTPRRWPGL